MSRYITSLIIFAAIFVGVFFVNNFAESSTNEIISCIDSEIKLVETESHDGTFVLQAQKIWDNRKKIFSAVVPHDKLDSIDIQFMECIAWAHSDDRDEYVVSLHALWSLMEILKELDSPALSRIV